jgi:hypothetical protein
LARYFAFLRAINVGGHIVKMERLRREFEGLGFAEVETFIASGNVIFESRATNEKLLSSKVERHLESALGYEVAVFIRSSAELNSDCALFSLSLGFGRSSRPFHPGRISLCAPGPRVGKKISSPAGAKQMNFTSTIGRFIGYAEHDSATQSSPERGWKKSSGGARRSAT